MGIDLTETYPGDGVTPNDLDDADTGPNEFQNYPELSYVDPNEAHGTLVGPPNTPYEISLYASSTCSSSGYGEGQIFLRTFMVSTYNNGKVVFMAGHPQVRPGYYITATATDPQGNTSEFSACKKVTLTVTNTDDSGYGSLRNQLYLANQVPGSDVIDFDIPGAGPHTITLLSPLPIVTDPVIQIDGTTQPGASCDSWPPTLMIEINGSGVGVDQAVLTLGAENSIVRGLVINNFIYRGVSITGDNNAVECNFIGTDITGTQRVSSASTCWCLCGGRRTA